MEQQEAGLFLFFLPPPLGYCLLLSALFSSNVCLVLEALCEASGLREV